MSNWPTRNLLVNSWWHHLLEVFARCLKAFNCHITQQGIQTSSKRFSINSNSGAEMVSWVFPTNLHKLKRTLAHPKMKPSLGMSEVCDHWRVDNILHTNISPKSPQECERIWHWENWLVFCMENSIRIQLPARSETPARIHFRHAH